MAPDGYRSALACRQQTAKVFLRRSYVHGVVSGHHGAVLRDRHSVVVQYATRNGAEPTASSSHRYKGLNVHRDAHQEARTQGSGNTVGAGYRNNINSCRVYNLAAPRIIESWNVVFNKTPSCLLPPGSGETPPQILRWVNGVGYHNDITADDVRLEPLPGASAARAAPRVDVQRTRRWLNP